MNIQITDREADVMLHFSEWLLRHAGLKPEDGPEEFKAVLDKIKAAQVAQRLTRMATGVRGAPPGQMTIDGRAFQASNVSCRQNAEHWWKISATLTDDWNISLVRHLSTHLSSYKLGKERVEVVTEFCAASGYVDSVAMEANNSHASQYVTVGFVCRDSDIVFTPQGVKYAHPNLDVEPYGG